MSECRCHQPPFDHRDYLSRSIGIDRSLGRHGEVALQICVHCGTKWLQILVEYEAFPGSSRWFRAPIADEHIPALVPEQAIGLLEQRPWYFLGGSYYRSQGRLASGPISVDP